MPRDDVGPGGALRRSKNWRYILKIEAGMGEQVTYQLVKNQQVVYERRATADFIFEVAGDRLVQEDGTFVVCMDLQTGKPLWQKHLEVQPYSPMSMMNRPAPYCRAAIQIVDNKVVIWRETEVGTTKEIKDLNSGRTLAARVFEERLRPRRSGVKED